MGVISMFKELDRVKIWNSYLIEAREFTNKLNECSGNNKFSTTTLAGSTSGEGRSDTAKLNV